MKIEDAIENYCLFEKGLSDRTKESYNNDLNVYRDFLEKLNIINIEDVKDFHIKEFLKMRNDDATGTIAHNLTVIKNFHSYFYPIFVIKY